MDFEWHAAKAEINYSKHMVTFPYAARVFLDPNRVVINDLRKSYGEHRYNVLGSIEKRIYVVTFTLRGDVYRIISARKANSREQKKYYSFHA